MPWRISEPEEDFIVPGDGMAAFARWRELVAPPAGPGEPPVDWPAFEESIGLRLPADYRAYADVYGSSYLNELFYVWHPTQRPSNLVTVNVDPDGGDDEQWLATLLTPPPFPLGLGRDRLLKVATSTNLDDIYWHTADEDPDRWPVVLGDEDGDSWTGYDLTLVEFLLALYTDQLPGLGFAEAGYVGEEIIADRNPFARS